MKKIFLLVYFVTFSAVIISSCSSVKQDNNSKKEIVLSELNPDVYRYEGTLLLNSTMGDQNLSFRARVNISGKDSISMIILGPLGITLGRLYSDSEAFYFLNTIENSCYTGTPSQENIKKATNINIAVKDLISLFLAQTPYNSREYILVQSKDDGKSIFRRIDPSKFADFAVVSLQDNKMNQYQRKDNEDNLILNTSYDGFKTAGKNSLPTSINFSLPSYNGKLIIEIENFKINSDAKLPEKFKIPNSMNIIDLNKK